MIPIGGLAFTLLCVFGSFALTGGSVMAIVEGLPFELLTILGAAVGSFAMANSMHVMKSTLGGLKSVLSGARYHKDDYADLLSLLYRLIRLITSKGTMAVESHIENPQSSTIFKEHPKLLSNKEVVSLICDYFRMIGMDADDPYQVEDVMGRELKKTLIEKMHPVHALQATSDGLPALGIIAAVLGVIKTMSHINEPPAVLGEMIAGALVGTFLGVLLAYGMVSPMAGRLKQVLEADEQIFQAVKQVIIASLHGWPQPLVVESARSGLGHDFRPGLSELLDALRGR